MAISPFGLVWSRDCHSLLCKLRNDEFPPLLIGVIARRPQADVAIPGNDSLFRITIAKFELQASQ
ncbi:MAG: hypothetical protein PVJ58_07445 [Chromatiales bacterium]